MEPRTNKFREGAAAALADAKVQKGLAGLYTGFHRAREVAGAATPGWEQMREQARAIKAHVVDNLDHYLEMVDAGVTKAGGTVFFAEDAAAATGYVAELARARGVRRVVKGKSMLSEEMSLNHRLEADGLQVVETDLGEYIIQLAGETPYHIIAPALHKSKEDVSALFSERLGVPRHEKLGDLTREARAQLREAFVAADMGITGANFVVAETGTVVLVTNEGNGRMCTSMPRIHVAITGMEKIVPSLEDMGLFLRLLVRSATGQWLSSYVTAITGPRREDDEDGPEEFHLVIVDNGRRRLLADPVLRESLYCLRCGACLNACPVYRKVGGHAYGWVYPGPIGAVITPVLTGLSEAKDLPYASSLCGACHEVCPVKINIPRMLLYLRNQLAEGTAYPEERNVSTVERLAFRGWRLSVANPFMLGLVGRVGRALQRVSLRGRRLTRLPPPLSGWTKYRFFPALASRPFRERWRRGVRD